MTLVVIAPKNATSMQSHAVRATFPDVDRVLKHVILWPVSQKRVHQERRERQEWPTRSKRLGNGKLKLCPNLEASAG